MPPILIGIDEAGRGPLAGPISVGAFAIRSKDVLKKFRGVKDSKQLTPIQREEWFSIIKNASVDGHVAFSVSFCAPEIIDERGLTWATQVSINRCLKKIEILMPHSYESMILLDGLLHAPDKYVNQQTIIGGDESEKIIALASICAKVLRDRKMRRLAKEFPQYGFEIHKGYATSSHYEAIDKYGLCPIHRRSFF